MGAKTEKKAKKRKSDKNPNSPRRSKSFKHKSSTASKTNQDNEAHATPKDSYIASSRPVGMMGPRRRIENQESPRMLMKDEAFSQ
ncbi:PREDICTED: ataxin-7-like protein 3 [Cyprinodon variegatus]|uniref:ataxin-7-like protein 3 n=1 Tax=Cyprinodon variegatus TaxID=28743 RepID=UPI0007429A59|nr:PREDICTED: ataxin-7-like protein 3 [Cyprinodon variegatus]